MAWKGRGVETASKSVVSRKWTLLLCIGCFCAGMLFSDRYSLPYFIDLLIWSSNLVCLQFGEMGSCVYLQIFNFVCLQFGEMGSCVCLQIFKILDFFGFLVMGFGGSLE